MALQDDAWCRECHSGFTSKESSTHDHDWVVPLSAVREALDEAIPVTPDPHSHRGLWEHGYEAGEKATFAAVRAAFGEKGDG